MYHKQTITLSLRPAYIWYTTIQNNKLISKINREVNPSKYLNKGYEKERIKFKKVNNYPKNRKPKEYPEDKISLQCKVKKSKKSSSGNTNTNTNTLNTTRKKVKNYGDKSKNGINLIFWVFTQSQTTYKRTLRLSFWYLLKWKECTKNTVSVCV